VVNDALPLRVNRLCAAGAASAFVSRCAQIWSIWQAAISTGGVGDD
jgi:hypothetical protein